MDKKITILHRATALAAAIALTARSAAAGTGGTTLPWNGPLDTIVNNLTGPTAKTIGTAAAFVGVLSWIFGRDEGHVKTIGKTIVGICALLGVVNLMSALGITGATPGARDSW